MAHSAITVANKLIEMGKEQSNPLTPMQIMKLVYICHGFMLGLYKRPLITQPIEAWRYGPVIAELYKKMQKYNGAHITEVLKERFGKKSELDEYESDLVEQVYTKYSRLSGLALSSLTHQSGTPWHTTRSLHGEGKVIIPSDIIEDYYSRYADDTK